MRTAILLIFLGSSLLLSAFGQNKYEREYRLSPDEIPAMAQEFVVACNFVKRVKWYGEESLDHRSVEAKVKGVRGRYSIEFDTLGVLEDVELTIPWKEVPEQVREVIVQELAEVFSTYRLIKAQLQWTGKAETLQALIRGEAVHAPYTSKYEIILKGRANGTLHWYECLFDEAGKIERKSRIVFRNTDNLDF